MTTHEQRCEQFRALHEGPGAFVLGNVWDGGSARIVAGLGFKALATSSAASAATLGRLDGQVSRDEALAHATAIVAATGLPVSADFENGFGDSPAEVAETIRLAGGIGLAGASIEDATGRADQPLYEFDHAVARIAAAVEASRALPVRFTLTARSENFLRGRPDLDDTIRRLQAFERAGADVLFAPGLPDLEAVRKVCAALSKPVNYMIGMPGKGFSQEQLQTAGVRRISLATTLYRAAMDGLLGAAREVAERGTFTYADRIVSSGELGRFLR
jgi:2-methylisocitrate lyase-like PEP mutase family enzyme